MPQNFSHKISVAISGSSQCSGSCRCYGTGTGKVRCAPSSPSLPSLPRKCAPAPAALCQWARQRSTLLPETAHRKGERHGGRGAESNPQQLAYSVRVIGIDRPIHCTVALRRVSESAAAGRAASPPLMGQCGGACTQRRRHSCCRRQPRRRTPLSQRPPQRRRRDPLRHRWRGSMRRR
jgi:hypothetical protein